MGSNLSGFGSFFMPFDSTPKQPRVTEPAPGSAGEEASVALAAEEEKKRAARRAKGGSQGTILTSPLGVTDGTPATRKTLLGA